MMHVLIIAGASFFHPQVLQDSTGTEIINGKVFVVHMVSEKETLYGISKRYGTTIDAILQYNPTADAGLEIGQVLKVPYVARQQQSTGSGIVHTVAAKETMFSISQVYNVSIDEIRQWNNLTDNSLAIGQQLVIRRTGVPEKTPASGIRPGVHIVGQKETMFSISKLYGVTVAQLQEWNKLESNDISIGQELIVVPPATAAKAIATPVVAEQKPVVPSSSTPEVQVAARNEGTVSPAKTEPREQTIRISEAVTNADEVMQTGLAELIEGTEGNRKYLALHRTAPVGTILKIRNEMNNREVFVRVMGKLPETPMTDKVLIKISKSAYDRLGAIDQRFRVEVTYYK